ncbi:MAG: aminopeptidase P family protein [Deltaproteobacteria bacterium]|nr:aminopeptidase P family protein [Deltaproteobacteria bacterium]
MKVSERVAAVESLMQQQGLVAYVIPSTDPHGSEYVAACWQRRAHISGFDGSAGTVVIASGGRGGLWTDSRYFLQAEKQLRASGIRLFRQGEPDVPELAEWLASEIEKGQRVGVDPLVMSESAFESLRSALDSGGVELVCVEQDLVERIWEDHPKIPAQPVRAHALEHAGQSAADKLARLRGEMERADADAVVISSLDEQAWLLNLRGADVPYNPVLIAYTIVTGDQATLFAGRERIGGQLRDSLPGELAVEDYTDFGSALRSLGKAGARVWLDPATSNHWTVQVLQHSNAKLDLHATPIASWKACKNTAEIAGIRAAHRRDGLAMVRFLHWLERALEAGDQTERSIASRLESFRAEASEYIGPSFETISAYAEHGAIVHYRVTEETDVPVGPGGIYLVDSGGQYTDGTTDITRTLCLGVPSEQQRRAYTAVLKGHLLLSRTAFREGSNGYQLDAIARAPLWAESLDYGHGTGHGVGAALCVHEGPFSVSLRKNLTSLQAGNVLSIEPGYYKAGEYGIRVENLALVAERGESEAMRFLGFETLTLCPYERKLIEPSMISAEDKEQIDAYHARVFEALTASLDDGQRRWLRAACAPV